MILQEDEAWLAHYGVKGMKWGVRKTPSERNKARLNKIYKKTARQSSSKIITGAGVTGSYQMNRIEKGKDPRKAPYAYAAARVTANGAATAALFLGASKFAKTKLSAKDGQILQAGANYLAAGAGIMTAMTVASIRVAKRSADLHDERRALEKVEGKQR